MLLSSENNRDSSNLREHTRQELEQIVIQNERIQNQHDGLTKDEINRMPITIVQEDMSHSCHVCFENFEKNHEMRTISCMHYFHPQCIDPVSFFFCASLLL